MTTESELTGRFIDAAVQDPAEARRLLELHPELVQARWLHEETVLHFLAVERYIDAVRLLIGLGFDPNLVNRFGDSPLIDVAVLGNDEIAEVLLAGGADPNATSDTLDNVLHCAIKSGNVRLVQMLIDSGARTDYVTELGETAQDAILAEDERREAIERLLSP